MGRRVLEGADDRSVIASGAGGRSEAVKGAAALSSVSPALCSLCLGRGCLGPVVRAGGGERSIRMQLLRTEPSLGCGSTARERLSVRAAGKVIGSVVRVLCVLIG